DYFPEDFLLVVDESHVTVPQTGGMYEGDMSRKRMLVDHGFRLPSAMDNRPLKFEEFVDRIGQTVYLSATPGNYEMGRTKGEFDVLVGINLLREGLDLPEVSLVSILDADKEGFLRSGTSLIQTIGRAARNVSGQVHMYADTITPSMRNAIEETTRRREKQVAYNAERGLDPRPLRKKIVDILDGIYREAEDTDAVGGRMVGGSGRQQSRGKAPVPGLSSRASGPAPA